MQNSDDAVGIHHCEEHKNGCQSKTTIVAAYLRSKIWLRENVTMISRHHLTKELRLQAIGRLEAGHRKGYMAKC
ncbi:hypothetical protein TNCV_4799451 [Trichonephila clavipes]|nr:hypothetical protein TNCV_4799451 [Trichonephila clavipes]